jgi:hypothetical protein
LFSTELRLWLEIYNSLHSNSNFDILIQENQAVSIAFFIELIQKFIEGNQQLFSNFRSTLVQFLLMPPQWLYNLRDYSMPILRGEACLALYNLFNAFKDENEGFKTLQQ